MENDILFKVLQLDSLIGFLNLEERITIHLYREGKKDADYITLQIMVAYHWIIKENWEAPKMKYGDDYLQYFFDPDSDKWLPTEWYLGIYPEYKTDLNKIKI